MRILHVVGGLNVGGAENFLVNLLKYTDTDKYQMHFLCYGQERKFDYTNEIEKNGGIIHFINTPSIIQTKAHLDDIKNFVMEHDAYDIIHIHTLLQSSVVAYGFSKSSSAKIIVHSHSSQDNSKKTGILRKFYRVVAKKMIAKYSDLNIACSKKAGDFLFFKEYLVLNNGVDVLGNQMKPFIDINNEVPIIIQVGRLVDVKNHLFSLELMNDLSTEFDFKFLIIGDGENRSLIEDYIEKNNLNEKVEVLGLRDDAISFMKSADLLILPSLFEGLPITLLETQSVGLPSIVSTSVDELSDIKLDLIDFINLDDRLSWKKKIIERINDGKSVNYKQISDKFVELKFDIQSVSKDICSLYEKVKENEDYDYE